MNLLQMSLSGALLILLVALIRSATLRTVPKRTFLLLWVIVAVRLLVPFRPPISLSELTGGRVDMPRIALVESAFPAEAEQAQPAAVSYEMYGDSAAVSFETYAEAAPAAAEETQSAVAAAERIASAPAAAEQSARMTKTVRLSAETVFKYVRILGSAVLGAMFLLSYAHGYRKFRAAIPVENEQAGRWLREHNTYRPLRIHAMPGINSPMTYGVLFPVILVPAQEDWWMTEESRYALEHEFTHVCRFDAALKFLLAAVLTLHWFNPAVWLYYILANRDVELSCDEAVLRRLGPCERSRYARALLSAQERRLELSAMYASFGANSTRQRITHIVKYRRSTLACLLLACMLVAFLTGCSLLSPSASAKHAPAAETAEIAEDAPVTEIDAAAPEVQELSERERELIGSYVWINDSHKGEILKLGLNGAAELCGSRLSWELSEDESEVILGGQAGQRLAVDCFGGFTVLRGLKATDGTYMDAVMQSKDYYSFAARYLANVVLTDENFNDYLGSITRVAQPQDSWGNTISGRYIYSIPNTALDSGLIYLHCGSELKIKVDNRGTSLSDLGAANPYMPFVADNCGWRVTGASGHITYVRAECVESVTYSEDGSCRIIAMKDGFSFVDWCTVTDRDSNNANNSLYYYAAQNDIQF